MINLPAQTVVDFEEFNIQVDSASNGIDGNGGFTTGPVFLFNVYDTMFDVWSNWAISARTDTVTAGFTNDLSAAAGTGAENTTTYAVSASFSPTRIIMQEAALGTTVEGVYVTNSTYAKLSMQEGDSFAKKFGGETGNDPDFFLLTIQKYLNGELGEEKVEFYLADYRFEDNSQDYILSTWEYIDLTSLGAVDSLEFSLSSSDVGQFGMNTPAYFCIDQLTFTETIVSTATKEAFELPTVAVYPNPTTELITVNWTAQRPAQLALFTTDGKQVATYSIQQGTNQIGVQSLPSGIYTMQLIDRLAWKPVRLVVK